MLENLKKLFWGNSIPKPFGSVSFSRHLQIYNCWQILKRKNASLEASKDIVATATISNDVVVSNNSLKPLIPTPHPVMIVGISKSHLLLAAITHENKGKANFLTHDISGRNSYIWPYYYYIPIEYVALYINRMNLYKVTDKQSNAVIDKSLKDFESNKEIEVIEVVAPGIFFKKPPTSIEALNILVIGGLLRHMHINDTLEKLNLMNNTPNVNLMEFNDENFKNDINNEYLKSIEKNSWDE